MEFLHYLAIVPILGFLMIAHEFGHFVVAKRSGITVEEFAIGFPPRLFSTKRGGVEYTLNLIPLGAYVKMLGEEDPTDPGSFASQPKRIRALVLAAGSGMNFLVAILAFTLAYATGSPDPNNVEVQVAEVLPASPAATAGLQTGDIIAVVNGNPVRSIDQFREQSNQHLGQPLDITLDRDGQQLSVVATPRTEWPEGQGPLGIRLGARALPVSNGLGQSLVLGVNRTFFVVAATFIAPVMVVRGQMSAEAVRPVGLPGMAGYAADAAAKSISSGWWFPVLGLTGAFSAGLAVANMLPLPALDGGRLAFVFLEAVRRKRISAEREGVIHLVGMAVLISLMVLISFHDVITPPAAIDWGIR